MGNESGEARTTAYSSSSSAAAADSYIGSLISLTSKFEIRYEGFLCFLNPQDSTLGLKNVRSYGTEGRKKDGPQIPPSDKVYEYILFRGKDIKDLEVKSAPPSEIDESIHSDPAIIQSQISAGASSSSKPIAVNGGPVMESGSYLETSGAKEKSCFSSQPVHDYSTQFGAWDPTNTKEANYSSNSLSDDWQGYQFSANHNSCAGQQPMTSKTNPLSPVNSLPMASPFQIPSTISLPNSNSLAPTLSHAFSNPLNSNVMSTFTTAQLPTQAVNSNSPLLTYAPVISGNQLNMAAFSSAGPNRATFESENFSENAPDPRTVHSAQPFQYTASPVIGSMTGPLLNQSPSLLTLDQLSEPRASEFHNAPTLYLGQNNMGIVTSNTGLFTSSEAQAPLVTSQASTERFTEEFDFEAMNEKFKKDEVWGYLGLAKQRGKVESTDDRDNFSQLKVNDDGPAYKKDDFFDTISCNSTANRARNRRNFYSDRMRHDSETFDDFQQKSHPGFGGYGGRRGAYRPPNPYGWGRGYHFGGRGRGRFAQW